MSDPLHGLSMVVLHKNYEPQGDHALLESPEITLNTTNDSVTGTAENTQNEFVIGVHW